jgi:hypothetical protein
LRKRKYPSFEIARRPVFQLFEYDDHAATMKSQHNIQRFRRRLSGCFEGSYAVSPGQA